MSYPVRAIFINVLGFYELLKTPLHLANPCPTELFQLYFSSFEAEIAIVISSSR